MWALSYIDCSIPLFYSREDSTNLWPAARLRKTEVVMGTSTIGKQADVLSEALGGAEMLENSGSRKSGNRVLNRSASSTDGSEQRIRRIEAAAYRRAGERGFEPGAELDDW